MNYLITAAGFGSRFCRAGIKPPKPLIRALGRELLLWSLSSFAIGPNDKLYIVALQQHSVAKRLDPLIRFLYPDTHVNWLELASVLEGQLLTALTALKHFQVKGPVIIHNCDTYHDATKTDFSGMLNKDGCFGVIPCFVGDGDHWSFVRSSPENPYVAVEVAEKKRISSNCSVGTYTFSNAEKFVAMAEAYLSTPSVSHTEFYIAPLYQYAIDNGESVRLCNAETTRLFGTPEELINTFRISRYQLLAENAWDAHQRGTLVVDIDGTLCGGPVNGDYSLVEPIEDVCEALRRADAAGFYIVLFTARNMRSFKGSLGLINKFTAPILIKWLESNRIPYDEIYFGKPWGPGVSYVDDKALPIEQFIRHH